jgi:hypothetical protein
MVAIRIPFMNAMRTSYTILKKETIIMANEREPDDLLPVDFVPDGAVAPHRVSDGEDCAQSLCNTT